jgi:RNA polymerase sigma factor (sigma-70 family)
MSAGGLEAVFLANRPMLLRFLRARGAGDAAEDLLQEIWLKASAAAGGPIADPLAYLFKTANNLLLDRRRSELRSQKRDHEWSETAEGQAEPSPEQRLAAQRDLALVEAELRALGERTDHVFRRYRVEGMSQREIAVELGISLSAVEKHLQKAYRALIELRRRLDAG